MATKRHSEGNQFLTVEEAAEKLGKSRVRVREAVARGLLNGRFDNQGRLRVDLPEGSDKLSDPKGKVDLEPDAIIGFLFDEVEELGAATEEKVGEINALRELVDRQAAALDRAEKALNRSEKRQARLAELLERALDHLENDVTPGNDLRRSVELNARFDDLLARAMTVAEGRGGNDRTALQSTADRAFGLLEQAVARAEAEAEAGDRTAQMLDRALAAGERMQVEITGHQTRIKQQAETIETALELSERAVATAADIDTAPKRRRGLLRWIFGDSGAAGPAKAVPASSQRG